MTSTDLDRVMSDIAPRDPFAPVRALEADLRRVALDHDLARENAVEELLAMLGRLVSTPNSVFVEPPEYRRDLPGVPVTCDSVATSTHGFFDVVRARGSRRDFGSSPLELSRLIAVLEWTVGKRKEAIAYDFRGSPLRYVPSAGGLASTDAYVVVNRVDGLEPGSYYFDHLRGLVPVCRGLMMQRIASMNEDQSWVADAAAVVVFVANANRVVHKYGLMAFKLLLLDAGVAAGHAELVATALELRTSLLGGLPPDEVSRLLRIDGRTRVPVVSLVVGTRPTGHEHG